MDLREEERKRTMTASYSADPRKFFGIERPAFLFLLFWLALNLVQVSFTELTSDEGYYWFYAQKLQWGYYDHPPLVALLIKAGTALFPGELGVRFFNVLLSTAALYLFFRLLPAPLQRAKQTVLVLLAAPLLHYLTFLVFPDGPLLFAGLLFLVLYNRFLARPNFVSALLLGFALALMAYAKYHGALLLLFTLLANPRLLKSGPFYLALAVAAVLFAPHLWWQYQNGFPTLAYHLSGRTGSWSFRHVGEYLSQQVAAIGPAMIFLPFVIKTKDPFERTLKFVIIGTFVFFLFSSFKMFVHFHWTSVALYPLLYFAVAYYNRPEKTRLFNALALPFVVLFFAARLLLLFPLIPNMHAGEDYYHGRKTWALQIDSLAASRPVFMPSSLRQAPLYSFYSGGKGVTLYERPEKKSQYELWGYEDSLQGKEVLLLTSYEHSGSTRVSLLNKDFYYTVVPGFQSYFNKVVINPKILKQTADSATVLLRMRSKSGRPVSFESKNGGYPGLVYSFEQGKKTVLTETLLSLTPADNLPPKAVLAKTVSVPLPRLQKKESYRLLFGIRSGVLPDAWLSEVEILRR